MELQLRESPRGVGLVLMLTRRVIVWLPLLFLSCTGRSVEPHLRIAAAASLGDVLPTLLEQWSAQTQVSFEVTFAGSGELAAQTRHGAPFDLLFLASQAPLRDLHELGLLQSRVLAGPSNRLVWLRHSGESVHQRVAIGSPGVPAGDAARAWLEAQPTRFSDSTVAAVTQSDLSLIEFPHVRSVLAAVESGACSYGFVYATDVQSTSSNTRVLFSDDRPKGRVVYGFAVPKRASFPSQAQQLAHWLQRQQDAWHAAGFLND